MNKNGPDLLSLLRENAASGTVPMHMPGHKRNPACVGFLEGLSLRHDITEIDGFDNLHGAEGILKEAMERAAALWGTKRSYYLVNGSSGGILSAIRALTKRGDSVLMSRFSHKSVYHSVEMCGLRPVYLMPPREEKTGVYASIPPKAVQEALRAHPEIRLVILTSPTYEGVISDIASIAAITHAAGVPLFVDEAHGAHLSLSPYFTGGAVAAGADVVVHSVHKTLLSLTQTAVLHAQGDFVDFDRLSHQLSVFETSSPSYLLMASIDGCVKLLTEKPELFADWASALDMFDEKMKGLAHLSIPYHGGGKPDGVFAYDRSKIYVCTSGTSMTGADLAAALRAFGIEPEMTASNGVLCMTGMGDTKESLTVLADALVAIDAMCTLVNESVCDARYDVPPVALLPEAALEGEWEFVSLGEAIGRVVAEYVWAYPPGIPLLVPGEEITEEFVRYAIGETKRIEWHSTRGGMPREVAVLR
ncbi:MAG: aminotransferase class I/II-fold pyridoxal phosphate-dependent enzyme [Clostridia bacterium]|nr:aminotransferase class I/II-fold pyridoxal phosphate-dependent enzyme [Clostridia bacterium]